ncbi:hypothetical protein [Anaeromyxobacter soli]|uniref:hypothetical protein n=1 Tax=Anaeromyxobacter soli TaxID=2922725 RepID=UPI001FAEDE4E|nr:hypothetical protein [Anaeromyxobacter sp. SG29]
MSPPRTHASRVAKLEASRPARSSSLLPFMTDAELDELEAILGGEGEDVCAHCGAHNCAAMPRRRRPRVAPLTEQETRRAQELLAGAEARRAEAEARR